MIKNQDNNIVSILLSTYKGDEYIEEQIISILKQNYKNFNIIIRDDGSKKNDFEFINRFSKNKNIKIFLDENNIGSVKSFNKLLSKTQSDYICFSDQDDVWHENKISRSLNRLKLLEKKYGTRKPILVHSDLVVCDHHLQRINNSFIEYQKLDPSKKSLNYLLVQNNVTGCTMMINRALKEKSMPIPKEARVHDWWFAMVASLFGIIDFINTPTVFYRQHSKNQIGAKKYGPILLINRFKNRDKLRNEFHDSIQQASAFYHRYKDDLNDKQKKMLIAFINIENQQFFRRKSTILKFNIYKQDLFRTLGLIGMV